MLRYRGPEFPPVPKHLGRARKGLASKLIPQFVLLCRLSAYFKDSGKKKKKNCYSDGPDIGSLVGLMDFGGGIHNFLSSRSKSEVVWWRAGSFLETFEGLPLVIEPFIS